MKEKIIEILDNNIRVHQVEGPRVRLQWEGYNEAADELAQMFLDLVVQAALSIISYPELLDTKSKMALAGKELIKYPFTEEQVEKALTN